MKLKKALTEFDVILIDAGPNHLKIIVLIRNMTHYGFGEVKKLTDNLPVKILEGVSRDAAVEARWKLEAEGATVEIS